jgi:hypothetical protein
MIVKKHDHEINDTMGVIYPIRQKNIGLLRKRKHPIYVKYLPHAGSQNSTRLKKGDFLFLYLSRKDKSVICYSKISSVSFKTPGEIMTRHLNEIQLNKDEFIEYVKDRKNKLLLFLELESLIELDKPYYLDYPITMAGKYVSKSELCKIIECEN